MSVPRAKKAKTNKPTDKRVSYQRRKIVEASRLAVAEAVWFGYNYYGYRDKRIRNLVHSYCDEMSSVYARDTFLDIVAKEAEQLIDTEILSRAFKAIRDEWRRNSVILTLSVMVKTMKKFKFSRLRMTQFVKCCFYILKENDVNGFVDRVKEATGCDVARQVAWFG